MNIYQRKLLGELIGLARATEGNEHLITDDSTAVIRCCLSARPDSEETLKAYLDRIEDAKRKMVPDCFLCANPCGKTSPYDLNDLEGDPQPIKEAKDRILTGLLQSDAHTDADTLYAGLILVGMEAPAMDFLNEIAQRLAK